MPQYVITRRMNGRDYYLENIYSDNKIVWITNPKDAITFESEKFIEEFINREFPNKGFSYKPIHKI